MKPEITDRTDKVEFKKCKITIEFEGGKIIYKDVEAVLVHRQRGLMLVDFRPGNDIACRGGDINATIEIRKTEA